MEQEKEKIILAVYGSLRKGCHNHNLCFKDDVGFIANATIKGFELYSLGSYPAIIQGKGDVKVELYDVTDNLKFPQTEQMELRAGYIRILTTAYPDDDYSSKPIQAYVYIIDYEKDKLEKYPLIHPKNRVQSGDWLSYINKKNLIYKIESAIVALEEEYDDEVEIKELIDYLKNYITKIKGEMNDN